MINLMGRAVDHMQRIVEAPARVQELEARLAALEAQQDAQNIDDNLKDERFHFPAPSNEELDRWEELETTRVEHMAPHVIPHD